MNIDDLTLGQIKALRSMLGGDVSQPVSPHIGKRCIIRAYASGVFCGELLSQSGRQVELKNSRRLWSWKASESISLSAVATVGVNPNASRFPQTLPEHSILDVIEIIPASDAALATIDATPVSAQK